MLPSTKNIFLSVRTMQQIILHAHIHNLCVFAKFHEIFLCGRCPPKKGVSNVDNALGCGMAASSLLSGFHRV
jgi:hypothetical protein